MEIKYKQGDRIQLINPTGLKRVSISHFVGMLGTVKHIPGAPDSHYYVSIDGKQGCFFVPPDCLCLEPINAEPTTLGQPRDWKTTEEALINTTTKQKEQNTMQIQTVRILKKPSVKAQEAGEVDELVLGPTDVVAIDGYAATAIVAAKNSDVINAMKGPEIRITVSAQSSI